MHLDGFSNYYFTLRSVHAIWIWCYGWPSCRSFCLVHNHLLSLYYCIVWELNLMSIRQNNWLDSFAMISNIYRRIRFISIIVAVLICLVTNKGKVSSSVKRMATKPQMMTGEGFSSIAGMSKSQLYELMSQMKVSRASSYFINLVGCLVELMNCGVLVSRCSFWSSRISSKRSRFWLTTLCWPELFSRWKHARGCSAEVRIWFYGVETLVSCT